MAGQMGLTSKWLPAPPPRLCQNIAYIFPKKPVFVSDCGLWLKETRRLEYGGASP